MFKKYFHKNYLSNVYLNFDCRDNFFFKNTFNIKVCFFRYHESILESICLVVFLTTLLEKTLSRKNIIKDILHFLDEVI